MSLFSIFIHQNTKSTTDLYIYSILEVRTKARVKLCLIDFNRINLPRRPQDVIFEHIIQNAFLYRCAFNIDYRATYRYVGKHTEGNIKNSFYICIKFLRDVQRTREKSSLVTPTL